MAKHPIQTIFDARDALGVHTNTALAKFLGVSRRTITRYPERGGLPSMAHNHKLIRALHPKNPQLARELAEVSLTTLSALGLEPSGPGAGAAAPKLPAATREHATMIVCAAADALSMVPRDVRPVLATVFSEARRLNVDLEGLAKLLSEGAEVPAKGKAAKGQD
jgi:hypothetical protein